MSTSDLTPFLIAGGMPCRKRHNDTPPTNLFILVPGPLGVLQAFLRRFSGVPIHGPTIGHPDDLLACLRQLRQPRTVVLCGSRNALEVAGTVLDLADLFVVPRPWLRAVHPSDTAQRAALAARLVAAHRKWPIQRFYARDLYDLVF